MLDKYNRKIEYARISVTNKCNLKCCYCMPNGYSGNSTDILSDDDIVKIAKALSYCGIKHIKITGGEPLLRNNLSVLISKIKKETEIKEISLTTNGVLLEKYAESLSAAGLDSVNISLDAISEDVYKKITGFNNVSSILNTINKIEKYQFKSIKINCVLIKDVNEKELLKIARLAKEKNICVKFIEMMPLGSGKSFSVFTLDELKLSLEKEFGKLIETKESFGFGPAKYFEISDFIGKIGMIGAMTHGFCNTCNRVRITSEGYLKTCLNYNSGLDLKKIFNSDDFHSIVADEIYNKQEKHQFNDKEKTNQEIKLMVEIGG